MMNARDETMPKGRWEFDESVTDAFDDMLARSIPQYEIMRAAVFAVGTRFVKPGTDIVDLGASRGEAVAKFHQVNGTRNSYRLFEKSEPMRQVLKRRFAPLDDFDVVTNEVSIYGDDLKDGLPKSTGVGASLILSVLTLMFIPIEYRQSLVQNIYDSLLPGGALILVEKLIGADATMNKIMVDEYYNFKRENGYSQEAIDRKRFSLEGVLVPMTAAWNVDLLKMAGFRRIDCFWRWMNFAGWVAMKEER